MTGVQTCALPIFEQDADVVILLHREDLYSDTRSGEADLMVVKHRNGPTRTIQVSAQLHFSRFVDMAPASYSADSFVKD